jgi:hypothetical protein
MIIYNNNIYQYNYNIINNPQHLLHLFSLNKFLQNQQSTDEEKKKCEAAVKGAQEALNEAERNAVEKWRHANAQSQAMLEANLHRYWKDEATYFKQGSNYLEAKRNTKEVCLQCIFFIFCCLLLYLLLFFKILSAMLFFCWFRVFSLVQQH